MKSEGGPPCLERGPSGAVQIGRGIFVLPLKEKKVKWNEVKNKKKTEMLELTFNSIKYSQARFFWSSIVFFLLKYGIKTIHCIHQAPVVQTMDSAIHLINRYPLDK